MDLELTVDCVSVTAPERACTVAGELAPDALAECRSIVAQLPALRARAADRLLALYNETWLADEIGVLDRAAFMSRLSNPSIVLSEVPGSATIYFDDGDVFGGHYVVVTWEHGGPSDVNLAG